MHDQERAGAVKSLSDAAVCAAWKVLDHTKYADRIARAGIDDPTIPLLTRAADVPIDAEAGDTASVRERGGRRSWPSAS